MKRRLLAGAGAAAVLAALGVVALRRGDGGPTAAPPVAGRGTVIVLHGLGRSARSMGPLARALEGAGYRVINVDYPSRRRGIDALADTLAAVVAHRATGPGPIHFVTHSMGGIVLRRYLERGQPEGLGRVVMLSPPNHGTAVVDRLPSGLLGRVLGPASLELGTGPDAVPASLPPADFELGVIAGSGSINPLFSHWLPGPDDGTVSVASARVAGATDFIVLPHSHTFIMRREPAIRQVLAFLETGRFHRDPPAR